jgi:hypothetical protein
LDQAQGWDDHKANPIEKDELGIIHNIKSSKMKTSNGFLVALKK